MLTMFPTGETPDTAYTTSQQGAGLPASTRALFSFADTDEGRMDVLRKAFGDGNAARNKKTGEFYFKKDGAWRRADEEGLSWADAIDFAGDVPELVGGAAGVVAGTPLGPAGQIGGAAVGTAAGRGVKKLIAGAMGVEQNQTPMDIASDLGESALLGAGGEAGGKLLGAGVQKVLRPSGGIVPEAAAVLGEAEAMGVKPLPGQATGGRGQQIIEGGLKNAIGSAGTMERAQGANMQALADEVQNILTTAGGKVEGAVAGSEAKAGAQKTLGLFRSEAAKKFDEARTLAGDRPITLDNFKKQLDSIKQSVVSGLQTQSPETIDKLSKIVDESGGSLSYDDLKLLRENVRMLADSKDLIAQQKAGVFKRLLNTLDNDIADWAASAGPDAADAWAEARKFYGKQIGVIRGKVGKEFASVMEDAPEQVVKKFFVPGQTTKISKLKTIVGNEAFDVLRRNFLTDLFSDVEMKVVGSGGVAFSPPSAAKLSSVIKRYGEPTLKEILEPEQFNRLMRLSRVADVAQRGIVNTSNTATIAGGQRLLGALGTIAAGGAAGVAGGPAGTAGMIALPYALSKLILSGPGRRYLTEGVAIPEAAKVGFEALYPGFTSAMKRKK